MLDKLKPCMIARAEQYKVTRNGFEVREHIGPFPNHHAAEQYLTDEIKAHNAGFQSSWLGGTNHDTWYPNKETWSDHDTYYYILPLTEPKFLANKN